MTNFFNSLYSLWNQIIFAISNISVFDVLDILIIAFIIYKAFRFLQENRGGQLVKGLFLLLVVYAFSVWFELVTVNWLLSKVVDWLVIALAIIFQPELRRMLERLGRSKIGRLGRSPEMDGEAVKRCIESVCVAAKNMQDQKIGALIVFERTTQLGDIINTGTVINADISSQMVGNIFFPKSPLHDGALIIRDTKLCAAGCILPLTSNENLSAQLGTRHRAAIGMSEVSDAVVLVVSEETGMISLVQNGSIERGFTQIRLREELYKLLTYEEQNETELSLFNKLKDILNSLKFKKETKKEENE